MTFRTMTVKECFANPQCKAIIEQYAPQIMKYPIKLFNKKSCGEIFDKVVKGGIVPENIARQIEEKVNAIIK